MALTTTMRCLAMAGAMGLLAGCAAQRPASYTPASQVGVPYTPPPGDVAPYEPAPRAGYARPRPQVSVGGRYNYRGNKYIGYSYPGGYRRNPTLGDTLLDTMTGNDRF